MVMVTILEWIVIGLVVGFITSKLVDLHGDDARLGIFVAAGGAVVVAALYALISGTGMGAWQPWVLCCAAIGAAAGAAVWHGVRSRYVSRERYVPRSSY